MAKKLYGRVLPRLCPKGKVIDYLNGDPHDERTSNKQFVTPEEAERRRRIRQILRCVGHDPRTLTLESLKEIYRTGNTPFTIGFSFGNGKEVSHAER